MGKPAETDNWFHIISYHLLALWRILSYQQQKWWMEIGSYQLLRKEESFASWCCFSSRSTSHHHDKKQLQEWKICMGQRSRIESLFAIYWGGGSNCRHIGSTHHGVICYHVWSFHSEQGVIWRALSYRYSADERHTAENIVVPRSRQWWRRCRPVKIYLFSIVKIIYSHKYVNIIW